MIESMDRAAFVLAALPPPPARVLEIGCGRGDLARALDAAGYAVVAIDPEAPEGPIFRQTTIEELAGEERFDAAVAAYVLHHVERLDVALDRITGVLEARGRLVVEEFGWDLVDGATAEWYAQKLGNASVESVRAEWRAEHEGLHGYAGMQRALAEHFAERSFEWRPYLYRCLERDELEPAERAAIAAGEIRPIGFRYVGTRL
jgi:ubiquinone/menaquinone biosynthesis C-methylase UbiE